MFAENGWDRRTRKSPKEGPFQKERLVFQSHHFPIMSTRWGPDPGSSYKWGYKPINGLVSIFYIYIYIYVCVYKWAYNPTYTGNNSTSNMVTGPPCRIRATKLLAKLEEWKGFCKPKRMCRLWLNCQKTPRRLCFFFGGGTPWKINMEHNHGGLEDDFPFELFFLVPC